MENSRDLHLSNVSRSFLPVFVRVAKTYPSAVKPAVDLIVGTMRFHRSNLVSGLYMLLVLSDANGEVKKMVADTLTMDGVSYYCEDEDSEVAGNARILHAMITEGKRMSDFSKKSNLDQRSVTIIGSNNNVLNGDGNSLGR